MLGGSAPPRILADGGRSAITCVKNIFFISMKRRVRVDHAILSFVIILTGFLYQFPQVYSRDIFRDDVLDFVGVLVVLLGTYVRMAARGHKKAFSKSGHGLVTSGLYTLVRNPMYLGSFLMGSGFILIVWPWWTLLIFAVLFYVRFNKQMVQEEKILQEKFGKDYEQYTKKVPRLFPRFKSLINAHMKDLFPKEETWSTQEKWGLYGWPVVAVILELLQEKLIFGFADLFKIVFIVVLAVIVFSVTMWVEYQRV